MTNRIESWLKSLIAAQVAKVNVSLEAERIQLCSEMNRITQAIAAQLRDLEVIAARLHETSTYRDEVLALRKNHAAMQAHVSGLRSTVDRLHPRSS